MHTLKSVLARKCILEVSSLSIQDFLLIVKSTELKSKLWIPENSINQADLFLLIIIAADNLQKVEIDWILKMKGNKK